MHKILTVFTACTAALISAASPAKAGPIPAGATCIGNCGTDGANGVVTLSPLGTAEYMYVTTNKGVLGAGEIASVGGTNGSELIGPAFAAKAGDGLRFFFNYATSDGSGFSDYAFAQLVGSAGDVAATLFTARSEATGNTSPGLGLPVNDATLTPPASAIIPGGPVWAELGDYSGQCFDFGCGYTGWIQADYTIATADTYALRFGVTNWADQNWDSGLALDGVTIVPTPAPGGLPPIALGLVGLGVMRRRRG